MPPEPHPPSDKRDDNDLGSVKRDSQRLCLRFNEPMACSSAHLNHSFAIPGQACPMVRLAEVLYEHHRVGNVVKVSAIDPASYTEVSIVGPATAAQGTLERLARRKLIYVLEKRRGSGIR